MTIIRSAISPGKVRIKPGSSEGKNADEAEKIRSE